MNKHSLAFALGLVTAAALTACGGGGSSQPTTTAQSVKVPVLIGDASSEDWATIGVKLMALTLTKSDGSTTSVPLGTTPLPINLAQLDQLNDIIASASLNVGDTYTGATLTLSANPGDVTLVVAGDPESGFPAAAGASIAESNIQILGATGAAGSQTVNVPLKFSTPLVVPASSTTALALEVDLSHPSFIIGHTPSGGGATIWAVNFNHGPVRQRPVHDIRELVLRHMYGSVTSISTDNSTLTIEKLAPTLPIASPETSVDTTQSRQILADSANKTLFYDLDAKTSTRISDFSGVAGALAAGKFVRVAARYQQDGTLVATRIWVSSSFDTVWVSPEGHVLHVNGDANSFVVDSETGHPVTVAVDANTQFFFRAPTDGLADATPIGTGPAFLQTGIDFERGFKVHVQAVDPLASPMVAQTVDIEAAAFDGKISGVTTTGFDFTRIFATARDDYTAPLTFISAATANGKDNSGNSITGFKYWNFAYPTLVDSGSGAITDFTNATTGVVNFGGTAGQFFAHGVSYGKWGDPANSNGWSAPWAILEPTAVPRATVASGLTANNQFAVSVAGGANPVTVDVSTASGSATLVYQVDKTNGVITISPQDLTTAGGVQALSSALVAGHRVQVSAVPQADGTLKAYVVTYFTGDQPAN
jgi:hypothetical protein